MKRTLLALSVALLATACGTSRSRDPADPRAYGASFPVMPAKGSPVQRLMLPPQILVTLQRSDRADLRLFDRAGRSLAMASLPPPAAQDPVHHDTKLEAYPILGAAGALGTAGITLNVEDLQRTRTVRLTRTTADDAGYAEPMLLGVLLDAGQITDPLVAIRLDANLPAQQPVTFTLETSTDLKTWQPLAEKVIYRSRDRADALGSETIPLGGVRLDQRYLRVTWHAASRLLAPVAISSAVLTTASAAGGNARPSIEAVLPPLGDRHELRFALPFATPIAAIRLTPAAGEAILPIRVLGRDGPEQPWTPIGAGTISDRTGQRGEPIVLTGQSFKEMEIEADHRTAGFTRLPKLQLEFEPVQVAVAFSGSGPFSLSAGLATAPDNYLPEEDIIPNYRAGAEQQLPVAVIGGDGAAGPLVLVAPGADGQPLRNILLWAALLIGTGALAAMVWVLWRKMPRGKDVAG